MIGRLDKELMNKLAEPFIAISEFKLDVGELIEQYYGVPLKEIDMPRLLKRYTRRCYGASRPSTL